jgi:hypothetical protein
MDRPLQIGSLRSKVKGNIHVVDIPLAIGAMGLLFIIFGDDSIFTFSPSTIAVVLSMISGV